MGKTISELSDVVKNHPTILEFNKILVGCSFYDLELVGGAVVDIIDGREPKDYDMIGFNDAVIAKFRAYGFVFQSETKTAITYQKFGLIVQFLQKSKEDFDFRISQTSWSFYHNKLTFDKESFDGKLLIPTSFTNKGLLINSLLRIPHWQNKGYNVPLPTYMSMVRAIGKATTPNNSYKIHS